MENIADKEPTPKGLLEKQWELVVLPHISTDKLELAKEIFDRAIEAYSNEGRAYHNLQHIVYCLEKLEAYKDREDFLQLWLALFWHDVVYDTHSGENEVNSGVEAKKNMQALGLPGEDAVNRLIVSTRDHKPESEDEALICAIDMSILATEPEVYDAYSQSIRQEYSWVPEDVYKAERAKVLQNFGKPFAHPDFVHLNEKAHHNLHREIENLLK